MNHPNPGPVVTSPLSSLSAKAIDPLAQIRSELGWFALLELLVGEERARDIMSQAILTTPVSDHSAEA